MDINGTRSLKDITDEELAVIVDMTREYGVKEYWGDIRITDVDRHMFSGAICVDFEQTRKDDGAIAKRTMFFEYNSLCYYVTMSEPWSRMGDTHAITEKPKMALWLIRQGFNLFEQVNYAPIKVRISHSSVTHGYLVAHHMPESLEGAKFFDSDSKAEAMKYLKETDGHYLLYRLIEDKKIEENGN